MIKLILVPWVTIDAGSCGLVVFIAILINTLTFPQRVDEHSAYTGSAFAIEEVHVDAVGVIEMEILDAGYSSTGISNRKGLIPKEALRAFTLVVVGFT